MGSSQHHAWPRGIRRVVRRSHRMALGVAVLVFVVCVAALAIGVDHTRTILLEDERLRASQGLASYSNALTTVVSTRFALMNGLHQLVLASLPEGPTTDDLDAFAAGSLAGAPCVRAIQTAPDGVVAYVYPEDGNVEPGNDLLNDPRPEVREDAQRTLESTGIVTSGPYELRQGGLGIVARQAVRLSDGRFWGFTIIVYDIPAMLDSAALASASGVLDVAIRDEDGRVFYGDEAVFEQTPVSYPIALPDSEWEIAAIPSAGWGDSTYDTLSWTWLAGIMIALTTSALVFMGVDYQSRLQSRVEEQTAELRYHEGLMQNMGRVAKVGGWEFDPRTGAGTWTAETALIHGVDPDVPTSVVEGLEFYTPESRLRIEKAISDAVEGRTGYDVELELVTGTGEHKWVRTIGSPLLENGELVQMRGAFQDITEQKLARDELEHLREHLQELVDQRTMELKRANEALDRSNAALLEATQAKSDFLASMSHELRTPLNSIIGFSDMLKNGMVGALEDEQLKQIGMINASGRHLLALINDVLDLAKVEAGAIIVRIEDVEAADVVRDVAAVLRPLADEKGLRLLIDVPDMPCPLRTDAGKLKQILLNLGGNAVKFTRCGTVELALKGDEHVVEFIVRDTGPGIPSGELKRVFEAFAQVQQRDSVKPAGTGLGLALSRQYSELLGGRIVVESREGEGSTFTLVLPCVPPEDVLAGSQPVA